MADYASFKVPELKKLLAERKLSQTGNKADLIARLQEEDGKGASDDKPAAGKEDEITYSDDEGAKPAAAAAATAATATAPEAAAPAADAASKEDATAAAKPTDGDAADAAPNAAAEPTAPPPSFAIGLSSTTADEEAKKRMERAKRFGIEENDDDDAKKRAERAARFGLDDKDVSGLDSALPERPLKRGRGQHQDGHRPGKRQSTDRRGGERRNGRQGGDRGGNAPAKSSGILDDPAEKAKAAARAARFAAA